MQHVGPMANWVSAITITLGLGLVAGYAPKVMTQDDPSGCYVRGQNGDFYDLGVLCTVSDG